MKERDSSRLCSPSCQPLSVRVSTRCDETRPGQGSALTSPEPLSQGPVINCVLTIKTRKAQHPEEAGAAPTPHQ